MLIGRRSIAGIVRDGPDSGTMARVAHDRPAPAPASASHRGAHPPMPATRPPHGPARDPRSGAVPRSPPPDASIGVRHGGRLCRGRGPGGRVHEPRRLRLRVFAALARRVAAELPDVVLGAGTIIDAPTAALFIAAGARFVVGQSLAEDVARLCNRRRIVYIPGCGTATEIAAAEELGCEIVKLFPAAAYDGPAFVRNFLAPSPGSRVMPTNVLATEEATRAWIDAGAAALGVAGHLYPADLVAGRRPGRDRRPHPPLPRLGPRRARRAVTPSGRRPGDAAEQPPGGPTTTDDRLRLRALPRAAAPLQPPSLARRPAPRRGRRRARSRGQADALRAVAGGPGRDGAAASASPARRPARRAGPSSCPTARCSSPRAGPIPTRSRTRTRRSTRSGCCRPTAARRASSPRRRAGWTGSRRRRNASVVAFGAGLFPGVGRPRRRRRAGQGPQGRRRGALLFEDDYPIRHWDHWLAPRRRHLLAAAVPADPEAPLPAPRDLQPDVETLTFEDTGMAPGARRVVPRRGAPRPRRRCPTSSRTSSPSTSRPASPASSRRATPGTTLPRCRPTGERWRPSATTFGSPDEANRVSLVLVDVATGKQRTLAAELDRWPEGPTWAPDGSALFFTADDAGPPPGVPRGPRRRRASPG